MFSTEEQKKKTFPSNSAKTKNFRNLEILLPSNRDSNQSTQSSAVVLSSLLDYLSPTSNSVPPSAASSSITEEISALSIQDPLIEDEDLKQAFVADLAQVAIIDKDIRKNQTTLTDLIEIPGYLFTKKIGRGGFSTVYVGTHLLTSQKVALKRTDKAALDRPGLAADHVLREIMVHKQMHHKNICELFEVHKNLQYIDLIMEYCDGGDLYYYVKKKNGLDEAEGRNFIIQALNAISYCHSKNVSHRDIKLENLMLKTMPNGLYILKLIDFGLTNVYIDSEKLLHSQCGSQDYSSPELLLGKPYNPEMVDVWALGVVLFCMITAELPFSAESLSKTFSNISMAKYKYPSNKIISAELKDLVSNLLTVDVQKRLCLNKIYEHPWVMANKDISETTTMPSKVEELKKSLKKFGFTEINIDQYLLDPEPSSLNATFRLMILKDNELESHVPRQLPIDADLRISQLTNNFQ